MKKVLVSVYVLSLDKTYDILLPINLPMKDVIDLIKSAIVEMSNGVFVNSNDSKLYEGNTGKLVNINNIVKFSGIRNGCKLMLV
ncbi:MAG: methyltransferase [Bacilli bacterium]|nr:methyltransferase [Bacilli bacterium]